MILSGEHFSGTGTQHLRKPSTLWILIITPSFCAYLSTVEVNLCSLKSKLSWFPSFHHSHEHKNIKLLVCLNATNGQLVHMEIYSILICCRLAAHVVGNHARSLKVLLDNWTLNLLFLFIACFIVLNPITNLCPNVFKE